MSGSSGGSFDKFAQAFEAIGQLLLQELEAAFHDGGITGLQAHSEIGIASINHKSGRFYQHYVSVTENLIVLLTAKYRQYFQLGLAHPHRIDADLHEWACGQLQGAVSVTLGWIRDWYMLACDGENQWMRLAAQVEFVEGGSVSIPLTAPPPLPLDTWRAPAWLFAVSLAHFGFGPLKDKNVPARDSDQKLGVAHTRLLLIGARRVFRWRLATAIEKARNEETVAAGVIPSNSGNRQTRRPNKRTGWEQRLKLYDAIRKVLHDNPKLEGIEFCGELDKRHAQPLFDWTKTGEWREGLTWKEAWRVASLKRKIRRVRQEAMKNH